VKAVQHPLEPTELQQIPLSSFVATAFQRCSKLVYGNQIDEVKVCFIMYSGAQLILCRYKSTTFVFAEFSL
jgi:hypothetical protein